MSRLDQNTTLEQVLEDHMLWLEDKGGSKADLSRADLVEVNLPMADLSFANLFMTDLSLANLSRTNLAGANLSEARLAGANLSGANLSGADLSGANLGGANLSGADLSGANLPGADLSGANLSGADLRMTNLSGTIFENDPPIIINTEIWSIIKCKDFIKIGCQTHSKEDWKNFSDEQISKMHSDALKWWKKYRQLVLSKVSYE